MTTATIPRPLNFAGAPSSAWAFGIRIWAAVVIALAASFWLELEAPSSAAITVAILAAPTRGQAGPGEGLLSVARDGDRRQRGHRDNRPLLPVKRPAPRRLRRMDRSVRVRGRTYGWEPRLRGGALRLHGGAHRQPAARYAAARLRKQCGARRRDRGRHRGCRLCERPVRRRPDSFPRLASQLAALHARVRDYAKPVPRDEAADAATAAGLLRDIAALRPEITSLATELASGSIRSAAARSTAVALVAVVHAARVLNAGFGANLGHGRYERGDAAVTGICLGLARVSSATLPRFAKGSPRWRPVTDSIGRGGRRFIDRAPSRRRRGCEPWPIRSGVRLLRPGRMAFG